MIPSTTKLGRFLRNRRLELDLRQTQVAKLSGILQAQYSMLEVGHQKNLKSNQIDNLATALECQPEEIKTHIPPKPFESKAKLKTELGKRVRSRRKKLGLSLEIFAERLGVPVKYANYLEVSNKNHIQSNLFMRLVGVLELDPVNLIKFTGRSVKTLSPLGYLVHLERMKKGLTLEDVALRLKTTGEFVRQIEIGRCPLSYDDELLANLAKALEIRLEELQKVRPTRRIAIKTTRSLGSLEEFLTFRRLELHMTQKEVGELIGVSTNYVSRIETGKTIPKMDHLQQLSSILKCEIPPIFFLIHKDKMLEK